MQTRSLRLLNHLLQEPVNVIDLRLELCESGELNIELLADVGKLFFNGREDLRSVRRRPGRSAQPSRAATPGPTALASRAVFPLWSAWTGLCRHAARFYLMSLIPFLAPFPFMVLRGAALRSSQHGGTQSGKNFHPAVHVVLKVRQHSAHDEVSTRMHDPDNLDAIEDWNERGGIESPIDPVGRIVNQRREPGAGRDRCCAVDRLHRRTRAVNQHMVEPGDDEVDASARLDFRNIWNEQVRVRHWRSRKKSVDRWIRLPFAEADSGARKRAIDLLVIVLTCCAGALAEGGCCRQPGSAYSEFLDKFASFHHFLLQPTPVRHTSHPLRGFRVGKLVLIPHATTELA